MNRALVFLFSVIAMASARAADIGTTYAFTPDLELEGNPAMASLGWPGIVAVNVFLVIATALMTYYWWRHPLAVVLPENRNDLWAFASLNYFGEETSFKEFLIAFFFKLPRNWPMAFQMTGVALPVILVVASGVAVFSWFAIHEWHWQWYRYAYLQIHFAFPYALLAIVTVAVSVLYFKGEHIRALKSHNGG